MLKITFLGQNYTFRNVCSKLLFGNLFRNVESIIVLPVLPCMAMHRTVEVWPFST